MYKMCRASHSGRLGLSLLILAAASCASPSLWVLQPDGRMNYPSIVESSGVAVSQRFENVLWTHNDSNSGPMLFAVEEDGTLIRSYEVPGAINRDWEDISLDSDGILYIFDNSSRNDPQGRNVVYIFPEPDPRSEERIRSPRRIFLQYPEGEGPFDCEAMFVWRGSIYLVTKPWDGSLPRIYMGSDLRNGGRMKYVGQIRVNAMVTGGDISADGKRIVLASYRALMVFEGEGPPERLLLTDPLLCELNARQVEAAAWSGASIVLTNEQREIYELKERQWRSHRAPFLRRPEETVPFMERAPSVETTLKDWQRGNWLRLPIQGRREKIGRIVWSPKGLHIGLDLPPDVSLRTFDLNLADDFSEWFLPGILYLMINPDGNRPIAYGQNDRCLVFTRGSEGNPSARALFLRPATLIQGSEETPEWVDVQERESRLLITIAPTAPGLGTLTGDREIGFNVLMIRGDGQLTSWAPLTRLYSWDQPNVWGLLQLED